MKKVSAKLCALPVQFPRRNSLVVLTEVHLRPCVYADLTLKCHHKLVPLAMKSWKNLSVHTSPVYIIIVLAKRMRIKRQSRTSFLLACYDIANKSFSCYPNKKRVRNRKYGSTISNSLSLREEIWSDTLPKTLFTVYSILLLPSIIVSVLKRDNLYTKPIILVLKNF